MQIAYTNVIARYFDTENIKTIHRNYTERRNILLCYKGDCGHFILKYRCNIVSKFNWPFHVPCEHWKIFITRMTIWAKLYM